MDTLSFFRKILPFKGLKLLAELRTFTDRHTGKTITYWEHEEFTDLSAMAEAVHQFEEQGRTVYHACNGFGDWYEDRTTGKRRIRTQSNVVACRSLYDDIDCGEDKALSGSGYSTKKEAAAALKSFLDQTKLPTPMIIDSGGGLHIYWPLTEDVSPEDWLYLANLKRRLTTHFGLRVDHTCDMDTARVLRPVGSINKKREPHRVVTLKLDCQPIEFSVMKERLESAIEKFGVLPVEHGKKPTREIISSAIGSMYPESYAEVIAKYCASIKVFKETGAPDEPLWHKCIGTLKYCVDGIEKIHEWSSKYDHYDETETNRKIENWKVGPPSCNAIRASQGNRCDGCTMQCTHPIQLGYVDTAPPPKISSDDEKKRELITSLWCERVRETGKTLEMSVKQEDGTVKWVKFSESVFYPVALIRNEIGEWEVTIEYKTRYGQLRRFQMPTAHLASSDKLASALAAHTIFLVGKNGRTFAMEHLKDIILGLQERRQEVVTEEAFGWSSDGSSFIIGNVSINEEGKVNHVLLSDHIKNGGLARDFGVSGTRDEWVRLIDTLYNRPGAEPYQFAFLVSAASPLIQMAGIDQFHGIPVAYTGAGGRGKTTVCRLACSIWGKGENFLRSSNKDGSTINGLLAMAAIYKNLPLVLDEMTGQKTEDIAQMLFALSNGQSKVRLSASGTFANRLPRWDLFTFITGNLDITGLLTNLDRHQAEAVSVRCFEIKIPDDLNETVFAGVNAKQIIDVELANNYGVVGRELIRVYMKNRAKIVNLIHKLRQQYQPKTADETRERFYIDLICFALAAGHVMKARDLIRFDLDAIRKWAFDNVKTLRINRIDRRYSEQDIVGDFISFLHDHTIVTKHILDMRRSTAPEVPLEQLRGEPLARKAIIDRRLIISAKAIAVWCKDNSISSNALREMLDRQGYIVHAIGRGNDMGAFNFRLGQGTTRITGLSRCYELDYDKVVGVNKEEAEGKVVPLATTMQVPIEDGEKAA